MGVAPDERPKLGDRDEAGQVVDLGLGIPTRLFQAAQVEQFRAVMHFGPKALQPPDHARQASQDTRRNARREMLQDAAKQAQPKTLR